MFLRLALSPAYRVVCPFTPQISLVLPTKDDRLSSWLHTKTAYLPAVTHPSTIRAQCTATTLIDINVLPLIQTVTFVHFTVAKLHDICMHKSHSQH